MLKDVILDSSDYYPSWPLDQDCLECRSFLQSSPPPSSGSSLSVDRLQCTDKCIIVECDQPDHLNGPHFDNIFTYCLDRECDELCDGAQESVEWPCTEPGCTMNELLGCCLNEIPSFPTSLPPTQPDHQQPHGEPLWSWVHSGAAPASTEQVSRKPPVDQPLLATDNQTNHALFNETPPIRCMWGPCTRSFSSQMDLLSHFQSDHLHPFSGPGTSQTGHQHENQHPYAPLNPSSSYSHQQDQMPGFFLEDPTAKAFPCLWDDCGLDIPVLPPCSDSVLDHPSHDIELLLSHLLTSHLHKPNFDTQEYTPPLPLGPEITSDNETITELGSLAANVVDADSPGMPIAFPCEWRDCTERFNTVDELNMHIAGAHVRQGKSSYECLWRGCNRHGANAFPTKQKVLRHMQKHSGFKPQVCSVCQERFAEMTSLQQHMRRHTQEKPYVCDFPGCGKAFSIPGGLRIHKRAHSGEKPFKCPEPGCDKAFSESSNLAKHVRTHSGLKPFRCSHPGCDRRFGRKDQLLRHAALHCTINRQEETAVVTAAG